MKIIITTANNFSSEDKSLLIKQGVCVIEAKNPEKVKIISDADFGDANQIMFSALDGIDSLSGQQRFFNSLYKRLKKKDD